MIILILTKLNLGILHGDFNEQNILVGPINPESTEYKIVGLIDFGDMQVSFYVFELAITMCYMMLECLKSKDIDPFVGSAHVLMAYRKHRKVSREEIRLLRVMYNEYLLKMIQVTVLSTNAHLDYLIS